eukprot:m.45598 g.45598  ORF g.45598 m.45598 type:complete len:71 (-) comp7229_c0_seq1:510-722(-)
MMWLWFNMWFNLCLCMRLRLHECVEEMTLHIVTTTKKKILENFDKIATVLNLVLKASMQMQPSPHKHSKG